VASGNEARALLAALCLVLGVFVTAASTLTFDRHAHRADVIETQLRILNGGPAVFAQDEVYLPTNQNRILVPVALAAAISAGASPLAAYIGVRAASAIAMFAGVAWLLRRTTAANPPVIGAALAALALALVPSFNYGWEQPSDFPDVLFVTALAAAAVAGRRWMMLVVAAVAAANRESAAFAGVLWAAVHWRRAPGEIAWRELAFGVLLSGGAMAIVLALRFALGGSAAVGSDTQTLVGFRPALELIAEAFRHPSPTAWPALAAVMFGPILLWLVHNRTSLDERHIGLICAAIGISALSICFGLVSELRRHIPALAVLLYVAVAAQSGWRVTVPRTSTA
jgi:hypothetical protein